MSKTQALSSSYQPQSNQFSLDAPVQPALRSKIKAQNLRKQLQARMVDLGSLQTNWSSRESDLRKKSEDLITQLKTVQRQFEISKNQERAKHLQVLDQLNKQHHLAVLDLQSQIDENIDRKDFVDDCSDLDQQIEEVKLQISSFQKIQLQADEEEEEKEDDDHIQKIELLEQRLTEMQNLHLQAVHQRDEESRNSTQALEELILNQQKVDDENRATIKQMVDRINSIDRNHQNQLSTIEKQLHENKRQMSNNLRTAYNKAAELQQKISKYQHDHKKEMDQLIEEETQYREALETLNAQHRAHLEESMNAAKKCSDEKRRFATMQHEVEELNGELLRETIEHENLIKEVNKMDNEVLNQMSSSVTDPALSFSFNRF
ncbi:hypothetical protein M9Y10_029004 [Tritrichomonas musculus]|uniref:Uncharacterized protein n=1 Tax=Tritrichomonas musculus TaxID=1915356 RepID=A0ABR2KKY9_9EUKA